MFVHIEWPEASFTNCISGLVVEYIVAIDVTRVRLPADAIAWPRMGTAQLGRGQGHMAHGREADDMYR